MAKTHTQKSKVLNEVLKRAKKLISQRREAEDKVSLDDLDSQINKF